MWHKVCGKLSGTFGRKAGVLGPFWETPKGCQHPHHRMTCEKLGLNKRCIFYFCIKEIVERWKKVFLCMCFVNALVPCNKPSELRWATILFSKKQLFFLLQKLTNYFTSHHLTGNLWTLAQCLLVANTFIFIRHKPLIQTISYNNNNDNEFNL